MAPGGLAQPRQVLNLCKDNTRLSVPNRKSDVNDGPTGFMVSSGVLCYAEPCCCGVSVGRSVVDLYASGVRARVRDVDGDFPRR